MRVVVLLCAIYACAFASNIAVFGTGLSEESNALNGGSIDPHYKVNGVDAVVASRLPSSFAANSASSQWIGTVANLDQNFAAGFTSYETVFDITGLDPSTSSLQGVVQCDDSVEIFLNEVSVGLGCSNGACSSTGSQFSINSGFRHGDNVLSFKVRNNSPSPSGLKVSVSGTGYNAVEFCESTSRSDWINGEGLYCWNGGRGYLNCFGDNSNTFASYKRCLSGSCHCPIGSECSNGNSSPCN